MNRMRDSDEIALMAQLRLAAEQALAHHARVVMPTAEAFRRLGFRHQKSGSANLRWVARAGRSTMMMSASPGPSGQAWHVTGSGRLDGKYRQVDALLPARESWGKVAWVLLDMWRRVFGPAVRPPGPLDIGRIYEQRREKLGRLDLQLPRLELDGPAFRKVRKQMRLRERGAGDSVARLAVTHGMLRIETVYSIYGVPARGGLGPDCQVPVADLLAIPDACMRGASIGLDRGWATLVIDWYCLRILNPSPPAPDGFTIYRSLLTGTYASPRGTGEGTHEDPGLLNSARATPAISAATDTGPHGKFDLARCFFTSDRSDSAFADRETLRCPVSSSALLRLAQVGWVPDAEGAFLAAPLAGKFWWVRGSVRRFYPDSGPGCADDVQTTEDLFAAIAAGHPAIVMDGPFDTKADGHYALDVAWESPAD